MGYRIDFDLSRCVGCGGCVVACIDQNDTDVAGGQRPRRRVEERERVDNGALRVDYLALACVHCGACIPVCPKKCLQRDEETGFVVCRAEQCIGCGACVHACPGQYIQVFQRRADKCDGCYLRIRYGYEPACVRGCITGALRLKQVSSGAEPCEK